MSYSWPRAWFRLKKSWEENFSRHTYKYNKQVLIHKFHDASSLTSCSTKLQLFLTTNVLSIPVNCACSDSEVSKFIVRDVSIIWDMSNFIRALDISSIELFVFPSALLQLVHFALGLVTLQNLYPSWKNFKRLPCHQRWIWLFQRVCGRWHSWSIYV